MTNKTLKKGQVLKVHNPLLVKTQSKTKHTPKHWHVVLEVTEEKVLLLPLSTQPLSKYNKLPQVSSNWHLKVDPNTNTYCCPNQMKWWDKNTKMVKDLGNSDLHDLSDTEYQDCLDCLYDDVYVNVPDSNKPWWVNLKQQLLNQTTVLH